MAFPSRLVQPYQTNSQITAHAVPFHASTAAGNRVTILFRAGSTATATAPEGWNLVATRSSSGDSYIWTKIVTSGEVATGSVTITTSTTIRAAGHAITTPGNTRIAGAFAASNVNDPPSLTHGWGSVDTLFTAVLTNRRSDSTVTAAPSNYGSLDTISQTSNTGTTRSRSSVAFRELQAASDDPGAFTTSGTINEPHSATIAISFEPPPPDPEVEIVDSTHIAASAADETSQQLTTPSGKTGGDFVAGAFVDDSATVTLTVDEDGFTELEWSIDLGTGAEDDDEIEFRLLIDGEPIDGIASLTVGEADEGEELDADPGSYAVTGADAEGLVGRVTVADAGAYAITGADAATVVGRVLAADAGSYAVTGADAETETDDDPRIDAEAGAYSVTGADATTTRTHIRAVDAGSYAVTGADAGTSLGRVMAADAGSYAVTGADAETDAQANPIMDAEAGSYAVTGADATTVRSRAMSADAGTYGLTGAGAQLLRSYIMAADPGSYAITGRDAATFTFDDLPLVIAGQSVPVAPGGWRVTLQRLDRPTRNADRELLSAVRPQPRIFSVQTPTMDRAEALALRSHLTTGGRRQMVGTLPMDGLSVHVRDVRVVGDVTIQYASLALTLEESDP